MCADFWWCPGPKITIVGYLIQIGVTCVYNNVQQLFWTLETNFCQDEELSLSSTLLFRPAESSHNISVPVPCGLLQVSVVIFSNILKISNWICDFSTVPDPVIEHFMFTGSFEFSPGFSCTEMLHAFLSVEEIDRKVNQTDEY